MSDYDELTTTSGPDGPPPSFYKMLMAIKQVAMLPRVPTAIRMSPETLSAVCRACGVKAAGKVDTFRGLPVVLDETLPAHEFRLDYDDGEDDL